MTRLGGMAVALLVAATALVETQGAAPAFKLGTFERQGRPFVGIVLRESVVVDLAAAHAAIRTGATSVAAPADMKDLIARYDSGVRGRILEIVRAVGDTRPAYAYDVKALKILPPMIPDQHAQRGGELPRARHRDGAQPRRRHAAAYGWQCAGRHGQRPGHLGARGGRHALEPVHVHQDRRRDRGRGRERAAASGAHADRVGVRAGRGDRQAGEPRGAGAGDGLRVRLHAGERHVRPRRPRRHPLRLRLADHQEPRHLCAAWART